MNEPLRLPFYLKLSQIIIGILAFFFILYIGQTIILPLLYAGIIAILLNPFVNFMIRKKINKVVAITIAVVSAIAITAGVIYIILSQVSMFSDTFPILKERFTEASDQLIKWISVEFNIRPSKIYAWIANTEKETINNMGGAIGQTLSTITGVLIIGVLIPVYIFMILFYKTLLLDFIRKLFSAAHHTAVFEVLHNSKTIIQSYLIGLLFEAAIIATLNSMGLLILGIDYAIILGIIGALLNVIPYIGGVIAIALPMIMAFVTKGSSYALFVLIVYLIIQFIDNHFIIPRIVASKVKINALLSVVVVLIGGALWGVPGMFLSIPLTAILKVIFDHIEPLKPWGFLLGNIVPTSTKYKLHFKKKVNK